MNVRKLSSDVVESSVFAWIQIFITQTVITAPLLAVKSYFTAYSSWKNGGSEKIGQRDKCQNSSFRYTLHIPQTELITFEVLVISR